MDFLQLQEAKVFFIYIYSNTTPATSLVPRKKNQEMARLNPANVWWMPAFDVLEGHWVNKSQGTIIIKLICTIWLWLT
jgi:hypothetical protein